MKGDAYNGEMESGAHEKRTMGQECGGLLQCIGLSAKERWRWHLRTVGVFLKEELHTKRKMHEDIGPLQAPGPSLTRSEEHGQTINLQGTL